MTIPYNSTNFSNVNSPTEQEEFKYSFDSKEYVHKVHQDIILSNQDFFWRNITKTLYFCLFEEYPKLKKLIQYFRDIARLSNKLEIPITWSLPNGLKVQQAFYNTKIVKFKPFLYSRDILNLSILDKNSLNSRKQISSLMPNFIHSLDAASLGLRDCSFFF